MLNENKENFIDVTLEIFVAENMMIMNPRCDQSLLKSYDDIVEQLHVTK